MASLMRTAAGIHRVVRLRQMLRNWRNKAKLSSSSSSSSSQHRGEPSDVPAGHVAIYVAGGSGRARRFVMRVACLNHPVFVKLLSEAEDEYGFGHDGPLMIPCNESEFEDVMRIVSGSVGEIGCGKVEGFRPLLRGLVQRSVW